MSRVEKASDILLVEDSSTDAELTLEAFRRGNIRNNVHHVCDGEQALMFLRRQEGYTDAPRLDLILLDLNMPKIDGREVLRHDFFS